MERHSTTHLGIVLGLSIFLVSCGWFEEPPAFQIVNETSVTLTLVAINSDGVELELATLAPGDAYAEPPFGCYPYRLEARTDDGEVVAAQEPNEICDDDEWGIR